VPYVVPVEAHLQPVNPDSVQDVFLSAIQIAILPQQKSSDSPKQAENCSVSFTSDGRFQCSGGVCAH
jgi:hypothetical protein